MVKAFLVEGAMFIRLLQLALTAVLVVYLAVTLIRVARKQFPKGK